MFFGNLINAYLVCSKKKQIGELIFVKTLEILICSTIDPLLINLLCPFSRNLFCPLLLFLGLFIEILAFYCRLQKRFGYPPYPPLPVFVSIC